MLRTKSADLSRLRTAATNSRSQLRSGSGMRCRGRAETGCPTSTHEQSRLRVEPQQVQLLDIQPGSIYEVEFVLRNVSVNTLRYKLQQPISRNFRVVGELFGSIASGLTDKIAIKFKATEENRDYFDELVILEEDNRTTVPLEARCSRPKLWFSPTQEMHFLRRNEIKQFTITVGNDGTPANLQFRKEPFSQYTVLPESFQLATGATKQLKVMVQPREVGLHRHTIEVVMDGKTTEHTIDLVYSVIEQSQYLLNAEGLHCKEISFDKIYYGQRKEHRCRLYNSTPRREELDVKIVLGNLVESGDTFIRNQTPEEVGCEETSRILSVQPQRAVVEPFQHIDLLVLCQPCIKQEHREKVRRFAKSTPQPTTTHTKSSTHYCVEEERFDYTLILSFKSSESNSLYCTVGGWCLLPTVRLSESELDFGRMICGTTLKKMLLVNNINSEFSVDLNFKKTAGVECQPSRKQLPPCGEELVEVKVRPVVLGHFCKEVEILLENLFTVVFRVRGEAIAHANLNKTECSQRRTELIQVDIERTLELENRRANTASSNRILTCHRKRRPEVSSKQCRTSAQLINTRRRKDDTLPLDESFDYGINPICKAQQLELPSEKDGLFVIRPVDRYQPFKKTLAYRSRLREESCVSQPRLQPRNHKEAEQVEMHLTGEQLKSIRTSCSSINFGRLFINSVAQQPFYLINELMTSIQARLEVDHPSLELIDRNRQVIGSSERGRFDIIMKAVHLGEIKLPVRYIINEHHQFELLVFAEIEQVHLFCNKPTVRMQFTEDLTMMMSDVITLKNEGNAEAHYSIENSKRCSFIPNSGVIPQRSEAVVSVKLRPHQTGVLMAGQPKSLKQFGRSQNNITDERVAVMVRDGVEVPLRIQASILEPKCYIKEAELDFSRCVIFKEQTRQFTLKNLSRHYAVFEIDAEQLDECLKVEPMLGRVASEGTFEITVRFFSKKELDDKFKIVLNLRAGASIHLPVIAKAILPNVTILEPTFNFGTITVLTPGALPLTLENQSELPAEMVLDLSSSAYDGLELDDAFEQCFSDESRCIPVVRKPRSRLINIEIGAMSTREFRLRMTPPAVRSYNFELPLLAAGNVRCKGVVRSVTCTAVEALLMVEPNQLIFHKKIIADIDKSVPSVELLTIRNLHSHPLVWRFGSDIHSATVFAAKPTEGVVENDKQAKIRFSFNPTAKGTFRLRLPLEIYDDAKESFVKFTDIHLEGEGDEPQLLFDKPELILPAVPLNVESKACFRIINEGYEHMDIAHKLDSGIDPLINVTLQFPEGCKVGINKAEVPVVATFSSRKPISFTAKLQFTDRMGKVYTIPVSGTAEASLLSNYPYFQCEGINYKLDLSVQHSVQLLENLEGTIVDRLLTFNLPDKVVYDQPRHFIQRWLCYTLNDETIGKFPESQIESHGEHLIKLIQLFAGRRESDKLLPSCDPSADPLSYYEQLIKQLKGLGCLLNNIRAYHLLDEHTYETYLANQQCSSKRPPSYKFWYVSYNAWIYLFYQVVAVFCLTTRSRAHQSSTKHRSMIKSLAPEKEQTPSNLYSVHELALLKWVESVWEQYNEPARRLATFKEIFEDGVILFYLVYHHLPVKDKMLEGFYRYPNSRSDVEANYRRVLNMLNSLGVSNFIDEGSLAHLTEKEYLLYLSRLHNILPCMLPKETVVFSCYLGDHLTKSLDIHNPSNKPVSYWIKMEGSTDFICEEKQSILVEPHHTFHLKVTFRSRTSAPSKAFVVLSVKREGTHMGSPMVFQLLSDITGRKSNKVLEPIQSRLYESTSVRVPVHNTFDGCDYGQFQVVLVEEKESERQTGRNPLSIKRSQQTKSNEQPSCFSCDFSRLKLKKHTSVMVQLTFLPLSMEAVRCYIVFIDPSVGEFQYEVVGIPEYPKPLQEVRTQSLMIDSQEDIELAIPAQNSLMHKARLQAEQRNNRDQFESKSRSNLTEPTEFAVILLGNPDLLNCIEHPKSILLAANRKNQLDEEANSLCRLKLTARFHHMLKDPNFDIILENLQRTDVRKLRVCLSILPKPVKLQVEMVTPARTQTVQNLPIVNNTDRDWRMRVHLRTDRPQFFIKLDKNVNNKELVCKRGSQFQLPVCFQPQWICRVESKLVLNNLTTNETVEYELLGIGEEPLSENHINIKCRLNEMKVVTIPINYPFGAGQPFRVETDLVNCYGAPVVTLPIQKKFNYPLTINPLLSGSYTGALTFYDEQGRYFWYTLTIETNGSATEGVVELQTTLFRPIEAELEIFNPTDRQAVFEIDLVGDDLVGETQFQVGSKVAKKYKLAFLPKEIYESKGRISFINERLGEKSFSLRLSSKQAEPISLPQLRCEIGAEKSFELPLPSHYTVEAVPAASISHAAYRLERVTYKQTGLWVTGWYHPTQVGSEDLCIINLSSPIFGMQEYQLSGTGDFPTSVKEIEVYSALNQLTVKSFSFENPFSHAIGIVAQMSTDDRSSPFALPKESRERINLAPQACYDIIYHYRPKELKESTVQICLMLNDKICWRFRLKGNVLIGNDEQLSYSTVCRCQLVKYLDLRVGEAKNSVNHEYEFSLEYPQKQYEKMLRKSLQLRLSSITNDLKGDVVRLHLGFRPTKPFKSSVDLYLKRAAGGVWRYRLALQATPPPPEETISIETKHGRTGTVSFVLPNFEKSDSKWTAKIQQGPDSEFFSVSPNQGTFAPLRQASSVDEDNRRLTVSYQPHHNFKNACSCFLTVSTEDSYWLYELKGILEVYRPPVVESRFVRRTHTTVVPEDKPFSPPCPTYKTKPMLGRNSSLELGNKFVIRRA